MSQINYPSTDIPKAIATFGSSESTLTVTDILSITSLTVTLNITAPNEGLGVDPSLLVVWLRAEYVGGGYVQCKLHDGGSSSLAGITYETGRAAIESLNAFGGYSTAATWKLIVFNYSNGFAGTINSWSITVTYPTPNSGNPSFPLAPAAIPLENQHYGEGVNLRRNMPVKFNFVDGVYNSAFSVPFSGTIEDFTLAELSTQTAFSLHKVESGTKILSTLLQKTTSGYPLVSYLNKAYPLPVGSKEFNKGDMLYLSIDSPNIFAISGIDTVCGQCFLRKN